MIELFLNLPNPLFDALVILILILTVFDIGVACFMAGIWIKQEKPVPLALSERLFVQTCIALSATVVAVPTIMALPTLLTRPIEPTFTTWMLLLSLILKSVPSAYWTWLYARRR